MQWKLTWFILRKNWSNQVMFVKILKLYLVIGIIHHREKITISCNYLKCFYSVDSPWKTSEANLSLSCLVIRYALNVHIYPCFIQEFFFKYTKFLNSFLESSPPRNGCFAIYRNQIRWPTFLAEIQLWKNFQWI